MIQAAIAAIILLGIYKFIDRNREPEDFDPQVDWWMAGLFIFAPGILILLLSILLGIFGLPQSFALFGYLAYFILPYCMLRYGFSFKLKRSFLYSIWVPVIAILTEIPFAMIATQPNV